MEDDEGSLVPPVDGGCDSVRRRSPGGRRKVRAERWKHLEGLGDHDALSARLTHASVSPPHACWLTLTVGDALLLHDSTTTKKKPPLMIPLLQHKTHPEIWFMDSYSVLLKLHECKIRQELFTLTFLTLKAIKVAFTLWIFDSRLVMT